MKKLIFPCLIIFSFFSVLSSENKSLNSKPAFPENKNIYIWFEQDDKNIMIENKGAILKKKPFTMCVALKKNSSIGMMFFTNRSVYWGLEDGQSIWMLIPDKALDESLDAAKYTNQIPVSLYIYFSLYVAENFDLNNFKFSCGEVFQDGDWMIGKKYFDGIGYPVFHVTEGIEKTKLKKIYVCYLAESNTTKMNLNSLKWEHFFLSFTE